MKKIFLLTVLITSLNSCQKQEKGFVINGTYKNVPDSTELMLQANNKVLDSAYVINESFQFRGIVEKPLRGMVISYKLTDYTPIWIENSTISIEGKIGYLKMASVTGSKLNDDENKLLEKTKSLRSEEIRLYDLYEQESTSQQEKDYISKKSDSVLNSIGIVTQEFIRLNPDSPISIIQLNTYKLKWGKETTKNLYSALSDENKSSEEGLSIKEYLDKAIDVSLGATFTDFTQKDTEGNLITFSEVRSDYTLIEFWGSWCVPCRKANPDFVKIYNKYKDQGFTIVGVATETKKENWLNAIAKDNLPWINLSDVNGGENEVATLYEVTVYPFNILIDKKGRIIAKKLNPRELEQKLIELL